MAEILQNFTDLINITQSTTERYIPENTVTDEYQITPHFIWIFASIMTLLSVCWIWSCFKSLRARKLDDASQNRANQKALIVLFQCDNLNQCPTATDRETSGQSST